MKKILLSLFAISTLALSFLSSVDAGYVNGYYRSNGTYVNGYYKTTPNAYKYDNYSYRPSQGMYNTSYYRPTKSYSSSWYTPNTNTYSYSSKGYSTSSASLYSNSDSLQGSDRGLGYSAYSKSIYSY